MIRAATQSSPNTYRSSSSRKMRLKLISEQKPPQLKLQECTQLQQRLKTPQSAQPKLQVLQSGQPELKSTSYKCNNPTPKQNSNSKTSTTQAQSSFKVVQITKLKAHNPSSTNWTTQAQTSNSRHIQAPSSFKVVQITKLSSGAQNCTTPTPKSKIYNTKLQAPKVL